MSKHDRHYVASGPRGKAAQRKQAAINNAWADKLRRERESNQAQPAPVVIRGQ